MKNLGNWEDKRDLKRNDDSERLNHKIPNGEIVKMWENLLRKKQER